MTLGAELRFAINIEYYHGFMGSAATIPDGFTAEGENYIKAVALTDNNYQLTADGKGNSNNKESLMANFMVFWVSSSGTKFSDFDISRQQTFNYQINHLVLVDI